MVQVYKYHVKHFVSSVNMLVLANCILIGLIYSAHGYLHYGYLQQKVNLLQKEVKNLKGQLENNINLYHIVSD